MTVATFTVLIPTHDHADTLWYAVQSVLQQSRQDFEVFIVGDGAPERTREIAAAMAKRDARVRFFDNPKGERHGEAHRHAALAHAVGRYVCYQADDDLWFPDHLERMAVALEHHDLAHSMQIEVQPDGTLTTWMFDASLSPEEPERMRRCETGFGLASGGHTLEAYRRLPKGWHPAPQGINTDLYFWLQFLDQPWCRYFSYKWPTVCHLSSVTRRQCAAQARVDELAAWWPRVASDGERYRMVQAALAPLNDRHLRVARGAGVAAPARLAEELVCLREEVAALRNSRSWRWTVPLRWLAARLGV